jgi:hypothetical protein
MARLTIELDGEQKRRLQEIAAARQMTEQALFLEALDRLLRSYEERRVEPADAEDPYAPLLEMIGLVKGGPTDASVYHDLRPGEDH